MALSAKEARERRLRAEEEEERARRARLEEKIRQLEMNKKAVSPSLPVERSPVLDSRSVPSIGEPRFQAGADDLSGEKERWDALKRERERRDAESQVGPSGCAKALLFFS